MDKKPTIAEIADLAGVSRTVVSNYLNGKFNSMSAGKKEVIAGIIKELDYAPNESRRNFKKKQNKTIGFVISDITDSFYSLVCKGVTDASFNHNCHVLIANTDNDLKREQEYITSFMDKTDGLIICTVGHNDDFLCSLKNKIPIVLADRSISPQTYDLVSSNNYEAIMEMMRYLRALDYEAFGFFTQALDEGAARTRRYKAFQDFAAENGLESGVSCHIISIYDEKIMMKELIGFLEKNRNKKSVVIGANGRTLLQLISCVNALELRIPAQIGVCGYDDFDWAPLIQSGITTINQPSYDLGFTAVEMLVKKIGAKDNSSPKIVELRSKLSKRASV